MQGRSRASAFRVSTHGHTSVVPPPRSRVEAPDPGWAKWLSAPPPAAHLSLPWSGGGPGLLARTQDLRQQLLRAGRHREVVVDLDLFDSDRVAPGADADDRHSQLPAELKRVVRVPDGHVEVQRRQVCEGPPAALGRLLVD